jgi:uncharacterized membrane protein YfcA
MMIALFIAIGLAAGVLAGLFGIGGGILIIPLLVYAAKFTQHAAHGTSLAALLLPVGALGAWEYWRNGHVNFRAAALLALGLFIGAWFGARLAIQLSPLVLRRTFAVFLLIVAARLWVRG